MLFSEESSAICVQRFDGSRNSAIHTTYRISLRSSSLREPRYPLLKVVRFYLVLLGKKQCRFSQGAGRICPLWSLFFAVVRGSVPGGLGGLAGSRDLNLHAVWRGVAARPN